MPEDGPRFDVEALREAAGAQAFSRGEAYCRNDQVALLSVAPGRVLAHVAGTEDYRIELTGRGEDIDGTCTCPAFDRDGFCKHMVVVALAVNARGAQGEAAQDDVLARIRQHLEAKPAAALVDIIVELAERDTALLRKLELAAAAASPKGKPQCLVPGCGAVPFNKRIEAFEPRADLLAPVPYPTLYERGIGRLRSALELPSPAELGR